MNTYVMTVQCPGQTGLVAVISGFLAQQNCYITELKEFDDIESGQFFCRINFVSQAGVGIEALQPAFASMAQEHAMQVQWADTSKPMKTLLLVSQHDHCLMDILYRVKAGDLNIEVTKVLSNHPTLAHIAEFFGVEFELLPELETKLATKAAREQRMLEVKQETGSELVVLARYMQILSTELCERWQGQCINIHHSFLPGFKGARPYHQAYERGVKQIGATAHYVTSDLDEGPIIEQEVGRVNHAYLPNDLRKVGRDMENLALAKAIQAHSERRVFINGRKTLVLQ